MSFDREAKHEQQTTSAALELLSSPRFTGSLRAPVSCKHRHKDQRPDENSHGCGSGRRWNYLLSVPLLIVWLAAVAVAPAADRQQLRGHVPAAVAALQPVDRLAATNRLHLAIGLPLQNQEALKSLLKDIYDPTSPNYRHYLTPEQFAQRFGPSEKDYQAVMDFAKTRGLAVTTTHPNRVILDVEGAVTDIEKAFHVTMRTYQHPKETRTFYASDTEPSLDVAVPILRISGLDNYALPRPRFKSQPAAAKANAAINTGSGPGGGYMGNDFRAAYVPGASLTGAGQTVGLLQFDGYTVSDITYYEKLAGLPTVTLMNVLLDGFNGIPTGNGGEVEVSLDIEMVISMAPGVSKIIVYEAGPNGNWHDILNRMANDNLAKQLSCSWYNPIGAADPVAEGIFQQMAAQGQSFFAASGDADAYTGLIPFPGDSPSITQVGGTTLTTTDGGAYFSETVWNWGFHNGSYIGSGGGISTQYAIPTYQQGISMTANQGSTTMRNVPDVALTADNVYVRADGFNHNEGGTSCAAPLWAGFMALVNQEAAANNRPTVGFINPAIYTIGKGASYTSTFNDTTTGNNYSSSSPTKFAAVTGYDLCTGWGTPTGTNLIYALAGPPDPLQASSPTFAASGPVGGPFTPNSAVYALTNSGATSLTWTASSTQTWTSLSATSGTLAAGDYTTVTWSINGGATALAHGNYSDTVTFSNTVTGASQSRMMTLAVGPPIVTTTNRLPSGTVGVSYNVALAASGGMTPYAWSLFSGSLPAGLSLSGAGVIGGSPSVATNASFTVQVAGNDGQSSTSNFSLTINPTLPPVTNIISGVTTNYGGAYMVGTNGPYSVLIVTNAGVLKSGSGIIGNSAASSNNYALVTGAGSVWSNSASLSIGSTGSFNQLSIGEAGRVINGSAYIGYDGTAGNNSVLVTGAGSVWSNKGSVYVGYSGSSNSLTIASGGQVVGTNDSYVGYTNRAANNSVLVTDPGSVWSNNGDVYVGYNGIGNSLTIAHGGQIISIANSGPVFNPVGLEIGYKSTASNNSVLVTGAGSVWSNNHVIVGYDGNSNRLTIANGGQVWETGDAGEIGQYSDNNSVWVTGTGSVWNISGNNVWVGDWGNNNSLTIANGGLVSDISGLIGGSYGFSNNSVLVTGAGSLWTNSHYVYVGADGPFNELTVNNGGQVIMDRFLTVGDTAIGYGNRLTIASGGAVTATNIIIGHGGATGNVATVSGGFLNATNATGGGALDISGGALNLNSGTVTVNQLIANNGPNSAVNFNGGTLNSGGSTVNNGSIFQVGYGTNAATLDLFGGTHSFANDLFINTNAILTGTGAITGSITNAGLIAPGNGLGVITDTGNLTILGGGAMTMELGGTSVGLYDQFDLTGALTFGGTLTVALLNGYTPQLGDHFNLFAFGNANGTFSQINLPTISPTLYWNISALYGTGVIEADQTTNGSLQVTLAPQAAIDAGAMWQVDAGGNWHTNNETVAGLVAGSHTVSYTNLTGWITPSNQIVQISVGAITATGGTYQLTPLLLAAVSCKTQGSAGTFDLNLNLNGTPSATVEPRIGGPAQLVFTFNKATTAADGTLDATEFTLTNATFVSASLVNSNLTLNLTNVLDQTMVTVVMNGLTDLAGNPLSGTNVVLVRSLYGDVNQNGTVNAVDMQQVKNNLLATLTPANFLCDVNCSGTINAVDLQQVKNNLLHSASLTAGSAPSTVSDSLTTSALATMTLGQALGATNLTWSTDGDAPWTATIAEDGSQAAWSGSIGNLNVSWVETTVTGPGTLSFDWMVSSELNGDYLTFSIDGVEQPGRISGEAGWQTLTFNIPAGTYRLTWTYSKNGATASGLDAGWLRRVTYR